jgi:hypothetical protein
MGFYTESFAVKEMLQVYRIYNALSPIHIEPAHNIEVQIRNLLLLIILLFGSNIIACAARLPFSRLFSLQILQKRP